MYFDEQALNWDNDPIKVERAMLFAKEILDFVKPDKSLNAFEFGCGTGLLSFQLKDSFKTITLADSSEGMIKVLNEKIAKSGIKNFKPLYIDLLETDLESSRYDVIFTLMTMHHIADIQHIITIFNHMLNSNGYICIADLVKEDGSFHAHQENFDGHNGFVREELSKILSNNGFEVEQYKIFYEINKETDHEIKKYPLFLMIGRKDN
jgi:2-polyprenyl-3-methyl-5-hydroxy-6-metoxy-1,4-benzoquinol methylase